VNDGATQRLTSAITDVRLPGLHLRPVRDDDAEALVHLIGAAYDEYACGPLDPSGFDADLAAPATTARAQGRRWWVLTVDGAIVASVAHGPLHTEDGRAAVELHRLYLSPSTRGRGLASALVGAVAVEARSLGATTLEAWSDTRLTDAHRRYLALGFRATGARRELHDPAGTTELLFALDL